MAPNQRSPKRETSKEEDNEKDERKRVGKACDRCRLKKSKCDGLQPCNRCQTDDGVCVYGERKKATEKIYPKGYTDQLVADHARLVRCVHKLYGHCVEANVPWEYPKVKRRNSKGEFLTHDILKSMDLIEPCTVVEGEDGEMFDDDPQSIYKKMVAKEESERKQEEAIKREAATPTGQDVIMQTPTAPMSRMSSMDSMQYNMHYPMLDKLQMPVPPPYQYVPGGPHYQQTPGGHLPPTPTESPSKEGPNQFFGLTQHGTDMSNRMSFGPQSRMVANAPQAPAVFGSSEGYPWETPAYTHPLNQQMAQPSPHMQYSALTPEQSMQMPAPGGPATTLAQTYESPMFAPSGLPDQLPGDQQIWNTAAFQTENDPDMGYSPVGMDGDYAGSEPHFEL